MRRMRRLTVLLPVAQVTLAILLRLGTPYYAWLVEWPETLRLAGGDTSALLKGRSGIDWEELMSTIPVGLNLPAYLLDTSVATTGWNTRLPYWRFSLPNPGEYGPRRFVHGWGLTELLYFGGIMVIWYWVGTRIEELVDRRRGVIKPRRKAVTIFEMVVALASALYLFRACLEAILLYSEFSGRVPVDYIDLSIRWGRQAMIIGLLWPAGLLAHFFFRLHDLTQERRRAGAQ